ncbi:hypothetical protein MRX96_031976 [Rhipicephalus microplus]
MLPLREGTGSQTGFELSRAPTSSSTPPWLLPGACHGRLAGRPGPEAATAAMAAVDSSRCVVAVAMPCMLPDLASCRWPACAKWPRRVLAFLSYSSSLSSSSQLWTVSARAWPVALWISCATFSPRCGHWKRVAALSSIYACDRSVLRRSRCRAIEVLRRSTLPKVSYKHAAGRSDAVTQQLAHGEHGASRTDVYGCKACRPLKRAIADTNREFTRLWKV